MVTNKFASEEMQEIGYFKRGGMLSKDGSTNGEAESHMLTYFVPNASLWSLRISTGKWTLGKEN